MAKFLKQFKHLKGKKHEHTIKDTEKSSNNDKQGKNPAPTSTKKLDLDSLLQQDNQMRSKKMQHYRWFHKGVNRKRAEVALCKDGIHDGRFMVRENAAFDRDFVLSFVFNGKVEHYHIIENPQAPWVYSLDRGPPMDGLDVIIEHYCSTADGLPTKLTSHIKGDLPPPLTIQCGYTNFFHQALNDGNETLALSTLHHSKCPDVNDKDSSGSTALHLVSTHGLLEAATLLLEKGALPSTCDKEGYTPLHRACMENHSDIVTLLVQKGANAQYRHRGTGNVALHEAAAKGNLESVRALLELCITCWPRNNDMKTPFELAKEFTHMACARYIDNHKPPVASTSRTSWLHEGVNREKAATLLLENGMTDGLFLVRTSASQPGCFVLSMSYERDAKHFKIDSHVSGACCVGNGPLLSSLEHLVEHYCMYQDGLPCILTKTISPDGSKMSMDRVVEDYEQVVGNGFRAPTRINSMPEDLPPPPPSKSWLLPEQLPQERVLEPASVELGHELGQGEFGAVFKGIWTTVDGQKMEVAIKTLNEKHINTGKDNFLREANVMARLDHPCIVKLIGVCMENPLMMVQELVPLGCLLDYLLDYPEKIEMKDLYLWAAQIACGMMYLEKEGFVHRDLAARNILLATGQLAKVGDFGLSRAIGANSDYYRAAHSGKWPIKWYAPESVNYGTFSCSSDVWSYAVTLWEIFSFGEQPYEEMSGAQVIKYIEHKGRLKSPRKCPPSVYQLMRRCWSFQATDRPTFEELHGIFSTDPEYDTNRNIMQAILK